MFSRGLQLLILNFNKFIILSGYFPFPDPAEPSCEEDQFACDGNCYDNSQRCDGHADCSDGGDERGCPEPAPVNLIKKFNGANSSIAHISPPKNSQSCPELQCPDGSCYSNVQKCDGIPDCRDHTDETGCGKL